MNILLTGPIQVGKSTVIRRLTQQWNLTFCGFRTKRVSGGVKLYPANGQGEAICALERCGRIISIPAVFDRAAGTFMEIDRSRDFYLMDEIGILERGATLFQQRILEVLDSDMPVLGVLKKKEDAFLNEIARREDTRIIEVSVENREAVFRMLSAQMAEGRMK